MSPITENRIRRIHSDTSNHYNGFHCKMNFTAKGMIPIAKNIVVVDEQGNEYEATYPKRAKGLVKNGRARFLSENKICLACPPDTILEDIEMADNNEVKIDFSYIIRQITAMQEQTEFLNTALQELAQMSDGECGEPYSPGAIQGQAKATAIGDIVRSRETTNQQILGFYEKVYNDLKSGAINLA